MRQNHHNREENRPSSLFLLPLIPFLGINGELQTHLSYVTRNKYLRAMNILANFFSGDRSLFDEYRKRFRASLDNPRFNTSGAVANVLF